MKKNAIIDIIENDLREMQTLLSSFKDSERIPKDFIGLLEQKHAGIGREIALLNYWASENITQEKEVTLTAEVRPTPTTDEPEEPKPQGPRPRQPRVIKITNVSNPKPTIRRAAPATAEPTKPVEVKPEPQPERPTPVATPQPEPPTPVAPVQPEPVEVKPEPQPEPKTERSEPQQTVQPQPAHKTHAPSAAEITTYGTPVDDIKKAIGFNDRFLYQREIFGGNSMKYDAAIEAINASADYAAAHDYLVREFHLDESQQVVDSFLKAVHRRFL